MICAELKLIYQANSQLKSQKYEVEIFLFFAAELEAVNTSLYSSLWQVIRLHTPKVRPFCNDMTALM